MLYRLVISAPTPDTEEQARRYAAGLFRIAYYRQDCLKLLTGTPSLARFSARLLRMTTQHPDTWAVIYENDQPAVHIKNCFIQSVAAFLPNIDLTPGQDRYLTVILTEKLLACSDTNKLRDKSIRHYLLRSLIMYKINAWLRPAAKTGTEIINTRLSRKFD